MHGSNIPGESTNMELKCYVCSSSELHKKFSILLFDGPYLRDKDATLRVIYECERCGHLSGDSYDPQRYADYYASLSDDYHSSHDLDQSRYKRILEILPKLSTMRVLDIGCGTGTFLAMLPPEVKRFGIEPSKAAAEQAHAKGIRIVSYDDLLRPELRSTFDLVTAVDVVEHTADLEELRRYISAALRPGGTVIILTGDAERPARFLGRYWSYLNYAEHISIFCPRSMRAWLEPDYSAIELTKTNHHPLHSRERLSLIRQWLLFSLKLVLRQLLPVRLNRYVVLSWPEDHMLVRALRK